MMLTPDQVRLRLDRLHCHESDFASQAIIDLLREVLPELVASRQPSPSGRRCLPDTTHRHVAPRGKD